MSDLSVTEEKRPLNGLRRSIRLQESGYYNTNGTPVISNREPLSRACNRRRFHRAQPRSHFTDSQEATVTEANAASCCPSRFWRTVLAVAIIIFILTIGCTYRAHVNQLIQEIEARSAYMSLLSTHADRMQNFADLGKGATVIREWSTNSYRPCGWAGIFQSRWCPKHSSVLQPVSPLVPGKCWPFAGNRGHLYIQLSDSVTIRYVTLGHISTKQSLCGLISSAPREFSVYGLKTLDGEEKFLGTFTYDQSGPSFQTFGLPHRGRDRDIYSHVRLQVNSNWGNTDYTCLYNIRVHGNVPVRPDLK